MRRPLATSSLLSITLMLGCATFAARGQQVSPATQPAVETIVPAPPPAAFVADDQGKPVAGVRLTEAELRAVVRGPLAQVSVTLTFANSDDRILGGEAIFPLPEGATVTGYSLEVSGSMVDGVAVDKQQARNIYEIESSRRVDPGFVEHVSANAFRTRIYPIPAYGYRSARVQYVTAIGAARDGATLSLPMGWGKVDKWTGDVESPDGDAEPNQPFGAGLAFYRSPHGFVVKGIQKATPRELAVRFPSLPGRSVTVEKWPAEQSSAAESQGPGRGTAESGNASKQSGPFDCFFLLNDTPPAPPAEPAPEVAAELRSKPVRRLAILWDAGLSRAASDKRRELKMLDSLLKSWHGATGELVVFRDTIEKPVSFDLATPGGEANVIEQVSHLTYDGASDLGDLPLPKNAGGFAAPAVGADALQSSADYDCLLLFTDGIGGIGPPMMRKAGAPVYVFSDDARENVTRIDRVCRQCAGRFYNLRNSSGDGTREPWSLLSVSFNPDQVAEVYPAGPVAVEKSGSLTLTGRLLTPNAAITLNYGYGNTVVCRQQFTLKAANAKVGDMVPRYWAQQKVASLSMEPEVNDRELTKLGKRFNLVTPNTSLLVLETASQYVRYHVVPPKNQPRLYQEFLALGGGAPAQAPATPSQYDDEQRFQNESTAWNALVQWWKDPQALERPAPEPGSKPEQQSWTPFDPQADAAQHAADLHTSRQLTRDAVQAQRTGDFAAARDLYARAVVLNPANAQAAKRLQEFDEGWAGLSRHALARARQAEQAQLRADDLSSDFQAALDRLRQDVAQHDLAGADMEFDKAQNALTGSRGVFHAAERKEFDARLAEARHMVDSARLDASRNARARHEQTIADTHAQRAAGELSGVNRGGGVNMGAGYHRNDYDLGSGGGLFGGSGGGGGGAQTSLFGGTGTSGPPQAGSPQAGAQQGHTASEPPPAGPQVESMGNLAPAISAVIRPWDPAQPYLAAMKRVPLDKAYNAYLEQRAVFGTSPPFYLDCADFLEDIGEHSLAVRVLSDVAAFPVTDVNLPRRAAYRLADIGERDRAIDLFQRVWELRPDQPQACRDLAMALSDRADALAALPQGDARRDGRRIAADYGRCLDLLNRVIVRTQQIWDVDLTCLIDANRVIARARRLRLDGAIPRVPIPLDPRLIGNLDCDLRVVVCTDTDQTRATLSVTEPDEDVAAGATSYHLTRIGGRVDDIRDGARAEQYCLRTLVAGHYWLQIALAPNAGDHRGPDPSGPCTIRVTVFTDFGRANEMSTSLSIRVADTSVPLGRIGMDLSRGEPPQLQEPRDVRWIETSP